MLKLGNNQNKEKRKMSEPRTFTANGQMIRIICRHKKQGNHIGWAVTVQSNGQDEEFFIAVNKEEDARDKAFAKWVENFISEFWLVNNQNCSRNAMASGLIHQMVKFWKED